MWHCACKKYKIDVRDVNQEPLAFCMWLSVYKIHKIDVRDINQESLVFCMWRCACKKHKIDVKGHQSGVPYLLYAMMHM
jgi:hypothetical protein